MKPSPSKAMKHSPSFAEDKTSATEVLTNDDLLGEIIPRLHCPACVICAALTSTRGLHNASNQTTIRSFCSRQSPQLLGIYVSSDGFWRPEFVPMPDASRPELATALHHGNFGFDGLDTFSLHVWDSRNDRVLYGFGESFGLGHVPAVRFPAAVPRRKHVTGSEEILTMTLLMRGKIYMLTKAGYILALDLATSRLSTIDLPEGVEFEYDCNLGLCRGDDSVLYLFHVTEDKLTVWLHRISDHDGAGSSAGGEWVLMDTIPLLETCGHLVDQGWEPADRADDWEATVGGRRRG
ncbi:hypothetical protein BAE44_0009177 [Dichanthelium oligosanthes]|uniref:F-box protein AT5G49610-like beta-propeller domain-containing protein n=1 Tax=Dichanthelium oligosanthes TaxID=888268 RepID=A0A1E5VXH0_9POAL|nr:hypothetical protein BAE44_0009177 [Dichanthelium oligosanthes]